MKGGADLVKEGLKMLRDEAKGLSADLTELRRGKREVEKSVAELRVECAELARSREALLSHIASLDKAVRVKTEWCRRNNILIFD